MLSHYAELQKKKILKALAFGMLSLFPLTLLKGQKFELLFVNFKLLTFCFWYSVIYHLFFLSNWLIVFTEKE